MDLFTEQRARHERAAFDAEINRANTFGPHLAAARNREPRVWTRAAHWLRSKIARTRQLPSASAPAIGNPTPEGAHLGGGTAVSTS